MDEVVKAGSPMVELKSLSKLTGRRILAKLEFLLPSGSVKDRAALAMVEAAQREGWRVVVEATAGNTGIALAQQCRARNMHLIVCLPDTTATQKIEVLRVLGVEVVLCPASAKLGEPLHFQSQAQTIADQRGGKYLCQFDNLLNMAAHEAGTGPEFWRQAGERLDAVVLSSGTGGTVAGVSRALGPHGVKTHLANCQSSGVRVQDGRARPKHPDEPKSPSILEGIGSGRVYGNLAHAELAGCVEVSDRTAIAAMRYVLRHEGFFVGGSSGLNVAAAVRVARTLPENSTVATVLCDGGGNYLSKHWSVDTLRALALPDDAGAVWIDDDPQ